MPILEGLGRSLRWLRDRQSKRQYQVAEGAGITKAMLSAYETGKQKPSLDTLEKILVALDCDLSDLHDALQIVNERPEAMRRATMRDAGWSGRRDGEPFSDEGSEVNVYRVLGLNRPLAPQAEAALAEMLGGFHKWLRYLHSTSSSALVSPSASIPAPPVEPEKEPK
jgi:HTH-type transcriptional regulator / antitoxin HipB